MNIRKRTLLHIFFAGEILIFTWAYIFGAQGLKAILALRSENIVLKQCVEEIKKEIVMEENNLHVWQTNTFYKEKLAREQLQMVRGGEEVYYTS